MNIGLNNDYTIYIHKLYSIVTFVRMANFYLYSISYTVWPLHISTLGRLKVVTKILWFYNHAIFFLDVVSERVLSYLLILSVLCTIKFTLLDLGSEVDTLYMILFSSNNMFA